MPPTNKDHAANGGKSVPIAGDVLIIVLVRNAVLFPVVPITIARSKSIAAAQQALREQRPIGILLQRNVNRMVRSVTAMTGEVSLRGLVLPVGDIKKKVVVAAGRVMLPARNRRDFDEIPQDCP